MITRQKTTTKMKAAKKNFLFYLLIATILLSIPSQVFPEQVSEWEWEGIPRIVAIGDVHGSYDKLLTLLKGTGMVDEVLSWAGEKDHLVFCGDLLDRGQAERAVLDLVIRLQKQAAAQGGSVHVILGNHDVMNLVKDLRYVHPQNYAHFASEEKPTDRDIALKKFKASHSSQGARGPSQEEVFNDSFPPGYFAREKAFDPQGQYGRWLITLPTIIKINGIVFVHGGLTAEVARKGLEEINQTISASIRNFIDADKKLEIFINGPVTFSELAQLANAIDKGVQLPFTLNRIHRNAAKDLLKELDGPLFSSSGPLWYRGNALQDERLERGTIIRSLSLLQAHALVVAHTPTGTGRITARFNGSLIRSDVGMAYGRRPFALVIEDNHFQVFDPDTESLSDPMEEMPGGEGASRIQEQLPDWEMEEFLSKADVVEVVEGEDLKGRKFALVELEREGLKQRAIFQSVEEKPQRGKADPETRYRRYQHEVASYLIDRKLGMMMVPPTVIRKLGRNRGSLQIWVEETKDKIYFTERGMWEKVREEFKQKYPLEFSQAIVLEALFDIEERHDAGIMLLSDEERVMLADNTKAFSNSHRIQERLIPELTGPISPTLEYNLRSLDAANLKKEAGKYLSKEQIEALLKRRDQILELCEEDQEDHR